MPKREILEQRMAKKRINQKSTRPHNPRRARRREQRRAFRKRFKEFFNQPEGEDMDFYENGLEWTLEDAKVPEEPE